MLPGGDIRYSVDPRDVPPKKAARRLHLTEQAFREALPDLLVRGFPRPDPTTGNFDLKAIDAWMDQRSGLTKLNVARDAGQVVSQRIEAMRHGKRED